LIGLHLQIRKQSNRSIRDISFQEFFANFL
jgi:hypothetical protein